MNFDLNICEDGVVPVVDEGVEICLFTIWREFGCGGGISD